MGESRTRATTRPGFSDTTPDATEPPAPSGARRASIGRGHVGAPEEHGLEVELVKEAGTPQLLQGLWCAVEVWTANTIYALDAGLVCLSVLDRASYRSTPGHEIEGATLLGGQERGPGGTVLRVSHPLPRVGASAVFSKKLGNRTSISETTAVQRVVYRLRVVDVAREGTDIDWADVSGSWPERNAP